MGGGTKAPAGYRPCVAGRDQPDVIAGPKFIITATQGGQIAISEAGWTYQPPNQAELPRQSEQFERRRVLGGSSLIESLEVSKVGCREFAASRWALILYLQHVFKLVMVQRQQPKRVGSCRRRLPVGLGTERMMGGKKRLTLTSKVMTLRSLRCNDVLLTNKISLSQLPRSKPAALCAAYAQIEKQRGTQSIPETTVLGKRRNSTKRRSRMMVDIMVSGLITFCWGRALCGRWKRRTPLPSGYEKSTACRLSYHTGAGEATLAAIRFSAVVLCFV
ncbi:hypothetical protein BV22DRAFT_877485 [Leucogyrophana mollusca]|uniref:Uncharacterized protein n=1 Tax=Leucogyrophana mollusca TaxID=85980 RepID=A0ACB8B0T3_9AGAM|nr:hypothetical protein BV22DRAFT_877485 [Leucogyrophana mollusca]